MSTPAVGSPVLCTICDSKGVKRCSQCRSVRYCSSECQQTDWPTHKLLCRSFSHFGVRPGPNFRRAILFPVDEKTPKFIWVEVTKREWWEKPNLKGFLGSRNHSGVYVQHNLLRTRELNDTIRIEYLDAFKIDGSLPNESIMEATRGAHEHPWAGPVVALRKKGTAFDSQTYMDITLGDFRHVVDYLIAYDNETYNNEGLTADAAKVKGVRISCKADQRAFGAEKYIPDQTVFGAEKYISVDVSVCHTVFTSTHSMPIGISKLIELPILLWKYPPDTAWKNDCAAYTNQEVTFLQLDLNPRSHLFGWAPHEWDERVGSVLAVRADRKGLSPHHMETLCHFCLYKLQPLIEDSLGGGLVPRTRDEVMREMTKAKFEKYFEWYRAQRMATDNSWRCTPSPYAV